MADGGMLDQLRQQNYPQMVFGTSKNGDTLVLPQSQATAAAADGVQIKEPAMYMHDKSGSVTLVPHSQTAAALNDGMNAGLPMAPAPEPGMLGKAWNFLNQPVGQHFDSYNQETQKLHDVATGPPTQYDEQHPVKSFIRRTTAGMEADVADQLSPLFAATAGAGAATKLPGAAGAIARTAGTAAGLTFAGQGAAHAALAAAGKGPYQDATPAERVAGAMSGAGNALLGGVGAAAGAHEVPSDAIQLASKGGELARKGADLAAVPVRAAKKAINPANVDAVPSFIKATKPRNTVKDIQGSAERGLPFARRASDDLGHDLNDETWGHREAGDSTVKAKQDIWNQLQQDHLMPAANAMRDVNDVGQRVAAVSDGMSDIAQRRNPGLVRAISDSAADYQGQRMSVQDIEQRIQELNNELSSEQGKLKVQQDVLRKDPAYAYKFAELDGLRSTLNAALDEITGPGARDLKQRYGDLKKLQDVIERSRNVADRQSPVGLFEGAGRIAGAGNMVGGVWSTMLGHPAEGMPQFAKGAAEFKIGQNLQKANNRNYMIRQAFQKTVPALSPNAYGEYMPDPGATSPIIPSFLRGALPPATREYGVPENPNVDQVDNREFGDSVTPLGPTGKAGVLLRPKLLPESPLAGAAQQPPPNGGPMAPVDHPDVPGGKVVGVDADSGLPIVKRPTSFSDVLGGKKPADANVPRGTSEPVAPTPQETTPVVTRQEAKGETQAVTPQADRRTDTARRKRIAEMSPEEMRRELLTSELTGLPNRRAFDEAQREPSPAVGMSDADALKAFNDKFGYEAGNQLLQAKADALRDAGLDAYHEKGDEFLYRGDSPEDVRAKLEKARELLRNREFEFTLPDGTVKVLKGADFSYGISDQVQGAETALKQHKAEREARGERARGELRGITEVVSQGNQGATPAEEREAAPQVDTSRKRKK